MVKIDKIIDSLTLEQKIGQMFMGNICGGESIDLAKRNFEQFHFGGLQFSGVFERFVRGGDYLPCGIYQNKPLDEVAEFLADIKQAAMDIVGIPTIIGGDQEGGISNSIFRRRGITLTPAQMGLGASGSSENTYQAASITAKEAKTLGLDMLYGPSLDVNTNPLNPEIGIRSFGEDPELVALHGEHTVKAFANYDIISTAKHFPGRGHGQTNAHRELENIDIDIERLNSVELVPFRRAISAGLDAMMMSHTIFPAIDKHLPASLSPAVISFLRNELGFDGMIIPDTLTMFAISNNFGVAQACAMCLEAGADMIFMKVQDIYQPAIEAIKESIRAGRLTEDRINRSLQRILRLKLKRGLFQVNRPDWQALLSIVGNNEHSDKILQIARQSVLVIKNNDILPIENKDTNFLVVVPRDMNVVLANDPMLSHNMLSRAISSYAENVRYTVVDESPTVVQSYETIGLAQNADIIVFGIYSSGLSDEQMTLLTELLRTGKEVIVVITGSPYVAAKLPDTVKAMICTFGIAPCTFDACAEIIFGKLKPSARLPVSISNSMPKGFPDKSLV